VEQALAKRLFARAARRPVTAAPGLADCVEALLAGRCRDLIGLARRAGGAVGGFEKVREAVAGGKAGLLLFALDGAPDARRKIGVLGRGLPLVRVLTAAELGAAFGRDHVVHASLGRGPLAARLLADAGRIAGFRAGAEIEQATQPAPGRPARQKHGIGVK
jgi:ribosomal protein L7Ae-like RNA K-turn-binding protein